jgi:hypothetical protein
MRVVDLVTRRFGSVERRRPFSGPLPWRRILAWSVLGCALTAWLVLGSVRQHGGIEALVTPGSTGSAATTIHHDFPDLSIPQGEGGDGQLYYAIARQPMHLLQAAHDLRWPRYWLQRPLFPVLAWVLHPSGGGYGLVLAMLAVGMAGLLLSGVAGGALAATLEGPAWLALVPPLVPGSWLILRASTPDALALGLVMAALTLSLRGKDRLAVAVAVAAVLTRETALVPLVGLALWRRDRHGVVLAAVPAAVALAWAGALRLMVPGASYPPDLAFPGRGLASAAALWFSGRDIFGLLAVGSAMIIGVTALVRRGVKHPLGIAVLLELVLTSMLAPMPMTMTSVARVVEPLLCIGLIAVVTPVSAVAGHDNPSGRLVQYLPVSVPREDL